MAYNPKDEGGDYLMGKYIGPFMIDYHTEHLRAAGRPPLSSSNCHYTIILHRRSKWELPVHPEKNCERHGAHHNRAPLGHRFALDRS